MHDLELLLFLCRYASCTFVYIQNRSSHRVLEDMTPKEALSKRKLEFKHTRTFIFLVYIHVPKYKRNNLILQERKAYLLDIVNLQRPTECTF